MAVPELKFAPLTLSLSHGERDRVRGDSLVLCANRH